MILAYQRNKDRSLSAISVTMPEDVDELTFLDDVVYKHETANSIKELTKNDDAVLFLYQEA